MTFFKTEIEIPDAVDVKSTEDSLDVELSDGRTITAPLAWYPRLLNATSQERDNWRFIAKWQGIHWDDLGEDISVENLLCGRHSGESQASLKVWLQNRNPKQN
jgi:hypothetical protein